MQAGGRRGASCNNVRNQQNVEISCSVWPSKADLQASHCVVVVMFVFVVTTRAQHACCAVSFCWFSFSPLATGGQHVRAATRQQPAAQRPPHSARRSVEYRAVNPGPGGDAGITRRRAGGGRHTHRGWARRGQAARIPTWDASPTCRREPTPKRRCGQDLSHNLVRASVSQRAAVTA